MLNKGKLRRAAVLLVFAIKQDFSQCDSAAVMMESWDSTSYVGDSPRQWYTWAVVWSRGMLYATIKQDVIESTACYC